MNKSFYNYIKTLDNYNDFNINELKLDELKKRCKKVSEYINFDINKSKKELIILTLNGIKKYIDTQSINCTKLETKSYSLPQKKIFTITYTLFTLWPL